MCFPSGSSTPIPGAPKAPSSTDAAVQQRVNSIVDPGTTPMQTVLTSPLGDPNYGKNVSRTILTGMLS